MKSILIPAALLLVIANALLFVPQLHAYASVIGGVACGLAVIVLIAAVVSRRSVAPAPVPSPAPAPPAAPKNSAEAEVVTFLAVLQEKGRFVDFLMDDITAYEDAEVGAAARVVHQGCRAAMGDHFTIAPVADAEEGTAVTVPDDHAPDAYRLTGNLQGAAPFTGTLVHKGWQTSRVALPRVLNADSGRLPTIAPAEVEIR